MGGGLRRPCLRPLAPDHASRSGAEDLKSRALSPAGVTASSKRPRRLAARVAPPPGPLSRLFDWFHTHKHGRVYEALFFGVIGAALMVGAYVGGKRGALNEPIAWLLGLVGACTFLFGLLPQKKRAPPAEPALKGKRAAIAEQVKKSKSEKRKGPPPPIH
jgi:hypothetical protein